MRSRQEAYAHAGYLTVAVDCRYHGERAQPAEGGTPAARAVYEDALVRAWRDGPERPFLLDNVWDLLHLMDYLVTRADVDVDRIGMTGFSLGGMHAWLLSAADPRLAAVATVSGVQGFNWALQNNVFKARVEAIPKVFEAARVDLKARCVDANVVRRVWQRLAPGLSSDTSGFDAPASLRCLAPRPTLVVSGELDARCPLGGLVDACTRARGAWLAHVGACVAAERAEALDGFCRRVVADLADRVVAEALATEARAAAVAALTGLVVRIAEGAVECGLLLNELMGVAVTAAGAAGEPTEAVSAVAGEEVAGAPSRPEQAAHAEALPAGETEAGRAADAPGEPPAGQRADQGPAAGATDEAAADEAAAGSPGGEAAGAHGEPPTARRAGQDAAAGAPGETGAGPGQDQSGAGAVGGGVPAEAGGVQAEAEAEDEGGGEARLAEEATAARAQAQAEATAQAQAEAEAQAVADKASAMAAEREELAEAARAEAVVSMASAMAAEGEELAAEVEARVRRLYALVVDPGVGHTETPRMQRAVRDFLDKHLLGHDKELGEGVRLCMRL
ncbi:hypothetical protein FOA52_002853 [Chlamydomonas sp. UWO 241]|nr:hypothetical protein FOA52_002853 [Chlamydomonas sp. UWO 241]